jgi:1-acyl-sn-glycerol-3-phosphate acyltransferase
MARCAGSLFVERRSKSWLADEVESIAQVLRDGFNVVVFPEGTTSCGESVLPFKASLFEAAKNAMVDVLPICLNYREIDRRPVSPANRDSVFYYGSMEFGEHFNRLLSLSTIQVGLCVLEKLSVGPGTSRKELTKTAYQAIQERYFQFAAI